MSGKKDATKSEGQSRKRTPSRVKDIDSHHKKSKHGANSLSVGPKKVEAGGNTKVMSKKERNELTKQRKARSQKNFDLIQQAVADWEKLRHHDTPSETRSQMVTMLLKKLDGRVAELAGSHSASRVVQACIKYGKASDREIVFKQVEPKLLELSKSPYGRFVVSKLISVAPKKSIPGLIKAFKGHAAELLRHPAGTHVLDDLYSVATPAQRNSLAAEFYGREYSLFAGGTLNTIKGAPASLMEILSAVDPPKRRDVIHHIASSITPVIEKGLVDCQLAHRLIAEYLTAAPGSLVEEAVGLLSGDAMMHMVHTKHGATASCMIFAYGTSKTRKKALKALKGHISTAVRDEWAYLPLITALSVVDDTASLQKFIVADIEKEVLELMKHKTAHRLIGHLLDTFNPRYVPPSLAGIAKPGPKVVVKTQNDDQHATEGEEGAGVAASAEQEGNNQENNEPTKQESPLGLSKKDHETRLKEIWSGGLGKALVLHCSSAQAAKSLLTTQHAADIVVDVARGGTGGLLEEVVGVEMINKVHAAIVEACMPPSQGEVDVLQDYFGSRALKRLVLSSAESARGNAASRFVEVFWLGVLKGRCGDLRETHAAKIVAAVCCSGTAKVKKAAGAELRRAGVANPEEWASTLLHPQSKRTIQADIPSVNVVVVGAGSFRRADGLGKCCRVYSLSPDNSSDSFLTDNNNQHLLAQLIVQKEELLKRSILPGKLPPKATVVASLRKEIAELRQQLRESMERNVPAKSASTLKNVDMNMNKNKNKNMESRSITNGLVNKSKPKNKTLPSTDFSTTAREALLLMERSETSSIDERQLMLVASSAAWPDGDQLAELESLTQENALLKSRLAALLEHQRKLKVLKERLKEGGNNSAEKNENEQSTKKPPSRPRKARNTSSPATKTKRKSKVEKSEKIESKEIETVVLEEVLV